MSRRQNQNLLGKMCLEPIICSGKLNTFNGAFLYFYLRHQFAREYLASSV